MLATEQPVMEALLFAFLTVLEINTNNQLRVAQDHPKQLLETQAWVDHVLNNIRGGSESDEKMKMLAAGVLAQTQTIVQAHQRTLVGDLVDYM